jgi:hypothetical protein
LARHRLVLDPALFESETEMVEKRFRLNNVVFRRTKADACRPDGSPLFARRWVHTESFLMRPDEKTFYEKLTEYLAEGFALAHRQGKKGVALGFVMTIFQKISASSFAAVQRNPPAASHRPRDPRGPRPRIQSRGRAPQCRLARGARVDSR